MENNNKIIGNSQQKIFDSNDRKLLNFMSSRWFTWGMALVWALVGIGDYLHHQFSWLDGLLLAGWCNLSVIELIAIRTYRRKAG